MCVCAFGLFTTNTSSLIIVDESVKSSLVKKSKIFLGDINQKNVLINIELECSLSFSLVFF